MEAYRFIAEYLEEFGSRWQLRRLELCSNAYYNYRKHWNADYHAQKAEAQRQIDEIYYSHNSLDSSRSMRIYLERRGYCQSNTAIHKYINRELGQRSIVRPQKPGTKP